MDSSTGAPRAIDVFAGAGGLTEGLKMAGFNVIGAIEIDEVARESYKANHPEVEHIWEDVRGVSSQEIMEALDLEAGGLDLLAGCPPCQGFSKIRTKNRARAARDERDDLVLKFLRLVKELRPRAVMIENVPGLLRDRRMRYIKRFLKARGYHVPVPFPAEDENRRTVRQTLEA